MRFLCFGYFDEEAWKAIPEAEQQNFIEACLAYDDELRAGGYFLGGYALQSDRDAITVRPFNGTVQVTDGPFAETKESVGGILELEARDLNHAVQLMSRHPGVRAGGFEIRPIDESFEELVARRRSGST